jgi:transposase
MEKFGEEVSEEVDIIPAQVKVLQHVRHKYACKGCQEGVKTAAGPAKVVEGGAASAGTVAAVIVEKYGDHKPLYRQSVGLARVGQEISRGTLCGWTGQGAERLRPLYDWVKLDVVKSLFMNTDDTPVRVLEPGLGRTRLGRFWEYDGDDRHPWTVWDYTANRQRAGPEEFLKNYKGGLQADAYPGYDRLYAAGVWEIACWAHARRKFREALDTDLRAEELLALVRRLYAVEAEARPWVEAARARYYATWTVSGPTAEGEAELAAAYERRRKLREERARPLMARIEAWLAGSEKDTLPRSPLGLAVQYARNQWLALQRYVTDGRLEIDNNRAENVLRRAALGRKNWLFVGSDAGGERAAILYTMLSTCARHHVNPWLWMKDVLLRISTHPASRIEELLPLNWKKLFAPR